MSDIFENIIFAIKIRYFNWNMTIITQRLVAVIIAVLISIPCMLAGIEYGLLVRDKETNEPIEVRAVVYYSKGEKTDSVQVQRIQTRVSSGIYLMLPLTKNKFRVHLIPVTTKYIIEKESIDPNGRRSSIERVTMEDDDSYYTEWIDLDLSEEERVGEVFDDSPIYFTRKAHQLPQPERVSRSSGK